MLAFKIVDVDFVDASFAIDLICSFPLLVLRNYFCDICEVLARIVIFNHYRGNSNWNILTPLF